ncbi:hypothetical protein HPB52_017984 [Rhipicephalus sanguineus]|uniref:Uncharacterized protein n=1 Tax=Rhipicephalus sanguineus TaxID=34632 RepID=A0A9D4SSZ2_RHISA|nr:hypothetical protein HPB52_017984 [Rhipicephalus sanguineus]
MDELFRQRKQPSIATLADGGDTRDVVEREGVDHYRPPCTAYRDQVCQINNFLPNCNELLFDIGLELREQRGGSLSLTSIEISDASLTPTPGPDSYRATPFLRWLLKTHVCISSLELIDNCLKSHSEIILSELPEHSLLKKLTLTCYEDDAVHTHTATVLPRLRSLEVLNCFVMCRSSDALVGAVSALLRTTTCLRSLVYHATDDKSQPPKSFIDALANNSSLKSLELVTYWTTDEPPGHLGEYVKSNRILTSLSVCGLDVDRAELLLEESLVHNSTLSTLQTLNVCGGERTVGFLTRLLGECDNLKELDISGVRAPFVKISEATLTRCAEALAKNEALEVLKLPYSLWHPNNWIAFFALLPINGHLKKLEVTAKYTGDYGTFPPVLEALAKTNTSTHVTFGHYLHGYGIKFMHFRVFSSIALSGEESVQVDALQLLPALDHITFLSLELYEASERVFSALAKYIRETTVLRKLRLTVTKLFQTQTAAFPAHTAASFCWKFLFESMSANTSVSDLDIFSNGNFQYNDHLTRIIGLSRYISRVSFFLNARDGTATDFVFLLSEAIGDNYSLLNFDLYNSQVGVEAKRSLFTIRETTRRNSGLVERAAAFNTTTRLDRYTATALEKVSRSPALLRELAKREGIAARQVASLIRSRLSSVEGLNDFMRLTGVVKECVTCSPRVVGSGMQLQDLSNDCWRLVQSDKRARMIHRRNAMENLPRESEQQLALSAFEERGDASAIAGRAEVDRYRPPCTAVNDQVCQLNNCLSYCNKLLFDSGLQLREQRGGSLSLVSIRVNLMPRPGPDSSRATAFLRWLLKTHVCITALELSDDSVKSHSKLVLQELPDNNQTKNLTLHLFDDVSTIKKFTLHLFDDVNTHSHLETHLPRLRNLEVLSCSAGRSNFNVVACPRTDVVAAVSALLRTTKCLTSLALHGCFGSRQPPQTLMDALSANSTLKWLDMETEWETAEPPGPLGEYVRRNGLLTSLTVSGRDADRRNLLLEETLVLNRTLSTLLVLNLCGGENSVRFFTRILEQCCTLRKHYLGMSRVPYKHISEARMTRCAESLAQHQTLEDLTLSYCLWHPNNWIAFFASLSRNKRLKKLEVHHGGTQDYPTFPPVLEALAQTNSSIRVSFGLYIPGVGVNLMDYNVFSRIRLSGDESVQVDALQRLLFLDHFTSLTLDVYGAGQRLFSALAKYIRETAALRELSLGVTDPFNTANNTATSTCWTLLFGSLSANKSIAQVGIFSNGNFQYNDHLTRAIGHSKYISRVSFLDNSGFGDATDFVSLLSEAIGDNYNLLKVNLGSTKLGVEAKRRFFTVQETARRNCGLVERAAAFKRTTPLDW